MTVAVVDSGVDLNHPDLVSNLVPGRDFELVTVSIDPRDTPARAAEVKARYVGQAGRPGLEASWRFLTGEAAQTKRLADAVGRIDGLGVAGEAVETAYAELAAVPPHTLTS